MKIRFLGTAAATACPLPFCRCEACVQARNNGGKDMRRRSSALIDGKILIDLGPDVFNAAAEYGEDISLVECLLQTHSHSDHFDAGHMITRIPDYAGTGTVHMKVVASDKCLAHMSEKLGREEDNANLSEKKWLDALFVDVETAEHGKRIRFGEYEIICVESAHDINDNSMMYIIRKGDSAFFYACDTKEFTDDAKKLLAGLGFRIDAMAIDQTYGPDTPGGGHLYANQVAEIAANMPETRVLATHISHEGTPVHEEMNAWANARGYEIAYDGMEIEI